VRICGIDLGGPGGLVVLAPNGDLGSVLHWRRLAKGLDLKGLRAIVKRTLEEFEVGVVATERPWTGRWDPRPSIGMGQREKAAIVKELCQERRVILVQYAPASIKLAVTQNGRATKEQVGRAVKRALRIPTDDGHVLDAGAIAMVALSREGRR